MTLKVKAMASRHPRHQPLRRPADTEEEVCRLRKDQTHRARMGPPQETHEAQEADTRLPGEVVSGPTPSNKLDSEPLDVDDDAHAKEVGES